ncbi:protealysin inhibitor emfourin [Janthinobacterium fluminis]|uniref:Uncharacterized protein n=1 Tax=Janthinobacterium fluminis TaxID=2987524 RepID=A0ABT5JX49_9BURK|nr:protealysin inhibitor emfourin [Janthinobacterium fluminis]MDC8757219.1 hypothetical protein [Janthinobacterium fluminis]
MKISASSGGGFAGLGEHYEIDTAASARGRALEAALADTGFFAAPAEAGDEVVGADLPRWRITVSADGCQHTVSFVEDGSPACARWQNLVAQIRAAA